MLIFIGILFIVSLAWSEQASCPLGKYLHQNQCILCTPGYYCSNGETRIRCPRGTTAAGYGFTRCAQCPLGWHSTCDGQETCVVCPKGFYCSSPSQEPQPCPIGHYSHYGAIQCTRCPTGYYTTFTNSSYCFQCPMGYACPDPTQCPQPCSAGTYQPNIMSVSCATCSSGHVCGSTTNLLECSTTSCIQAETWTCDANQRIPSSSVCTNIG